MNLFQFLRRLRPPRRRKTNPFKSFSRQRVEREAPEWYATWRERIHTWVGGAVDPALASIITLVPDLLIFLVRLSRDPRVPLTTKAQIVLAATYVISPIDLIPEGLLGVIGLADDAGVLALVLYGLNQMRGIDSSVLKDNWPGKDDVEQVIENFHDTVTNNRERIMSGEIWRKIEAIFGRKSERKAKPERAPFIRNWRNWRRASS